MLHASGEREGSRMDSRRGGVLQAQAAARRARAAAADAGVRRPARPLLHSTLTL